MLTYLFKGLGQNIVSLTSDEMERIYEERMDKIKSLGLSGIMTASLEQELTKSLDEDEDEVESKGEMIQIPLTIGQENQSKVDFFVSLSSVL